MVVLMMAMVAIFIQLQAQAMMEAKTINQLQEASISSVKEVDSRLGSIVSSLQTFSATYQNSTISNGAAFEIFTSMKANNPDISELQLATTDGKYLTFPGSPTDSSYDPRTSDWYTGALQQKKVFISDIFQYSKTEFPKFAISVPLYSGDDEEAKGVLVAFVSIANLNTFVENIKIGQSGYVFIVDHQGKVVAYPEKTYALSRPSLADLSVVQQVMQGKSGIGEFAREGTAYLSAYEYLPKLNWGVVVAQTTEEVRADAVKLQLIIIMVSVIGIALLWLGIYFFARRIVHPIQDIQAKMVKLSEGDLSQRLEPSSSDEIGSLAISFNTMSQKVRDILMQISTAAVDVRDIALDVTASSQHSFGMQNEIVQITDSLSLDMEKQKERVNELQEIIDTIANEVQEIHQQIQLAASYNNQAHQGASEVNHSITELNGKMQRVVHNMEASTHAFTDLHSSVHEVNHILSWITDISKKTKLLSLNARIEASRAGQAGLGFGVVAEEIRKLSEHTEEATIQIADLLKVIQDKVEIVTVKMAQTDQTTSEGLVTLEETAANIKQIATNIKGLHDCFADITNSSASIHTKNQCIQNEITQLAHSFETVASVSQQAVAATQESASISQHFLQSSQQLLQVVTTLEQEINYFDLGHAEKN